MESRKIQEAQTKAKELLHVVEKIVALHRNLLDILKEEYGHMSTVDVKGLHETAQTKEILVSEIWNHEQLRIRVTDQISAILEPIERPQMTLAQIADYITGPDSDKLRSARTVLQMLIQAAKESNLRNMEFAESSLVRVEEMKRNVLGLNNNNKENYSNTGVRQPITEQQGRLLSTEA